MKNIEEKQLLNNTKCSEIALLKWHFGELFKLIKHGDQEHQDWLESKMKEYIEKL